MMRYFFVVFFLIAAVGLIWLFFGPAVRSWGKRFSGTLEDNWDAVDQETELDERPYRVCAAEDCGVQMFGEDRYCQHHEGQHIFDAKHGTSTAPPDHK